MDRVLFVGSYGVGNLGDEAILSVLLERLRPRRPVIISRSPAESARLHGVRSVHALRPAALFEGLRSDAVVLGGGGIFSGLSGRLTAGLPIYLRTLQLAGRSVHVHALGIYEDTPPATLRRMLKVLGAAAYVSVRDLSSQEFLERHGIHAEKVPDPALSIVPAPRNTAVEVLAAEGIPTDRRFVGVSPRRVRDPVLQETLHRELKVTLRMLQEEGRDILFLPTAHFHFGTFTNDLDYSRELASDLDPARTFVVRGLYPPRIACSLFGIPDAHITVRLHAMVFAWRAGRPAVSIGYADKVTDVASELGVPSIPIAALDHAVLLDLIRAVK